MQTLIIACLSFVGSHLLLSHPLRAPLVRIVGEKVFALLYSVIALATLFWVWRAFVAAPAGAPAWMVGAFGWGVASAAMWLATVLLVGSFANNPALPAPYARAAAMRNPAGVFAITRHPMMWSFAIWAVVHIAIWPTPENAVLATAILALALIGAAGQDRKKAVAMGDAWRGWCRRTAFFPFAGQIGGRVPLGAIWPGWAIIVVATGIWLVLTWAHIPLGSRMPAGIWYWAT
ncbi:MAG: NnrU family protein [Sphingopyxis sp.]|jgi:uncharacterized membrane protein|nr:NnrU family protein [Sphingopyxis sp.]